MPKTHKQKRTSKHVASEKRVSHENRVPDLPARQVRGSSLSTGGQNLQNLAFSGMVALGCWGMAFFFAFFYTEANRYLYGAIMAITALGWSIIVARRWSTYRQRA